MRMCGNGNPLPSATFHANPSLPSWRNATLSLSFARAQGSVPSGTGQCDWPRPDAAQVETVLVRRVAVVVLSGSSHTSICPLPVRLPQYIVEPAPCASAVFCAGPSAFL